jgi:hypothetical protein
MGEHASMPVAARAAIAEYRGPAAGELLQSFLRLLRQGPGLETGAAERQLGRLNALEPDLPPIVEKHGIAIDDAGDRDGLTGLKRATAGLLTRCILAGGSPLSAGGSRTGKGYEDEQQDCQKCGALPGTAEAPETWTGGR